MMGQEGQENPNILDNSKEVTPGATPDPAKTGENAQQVEKDEQPKANVETDEEEKVLQKTADGIDTEISDKKKRHSRPWKILPSEKDEVKRGKSKKTNKTFFESLKKHKKIIFVAIAIIVAFFVGFWTKGTISSNKANEADVASDESEDEEDDDGVISDYPKDMTIEKAPTTSYAFNYAVDSMTDEVTKGLDDKPETAKKALIKDRITEYINKQKTEYEKIFYTLAGIEVLNQYDDTDTSKLMLEQFDEGKYKLDDKQDYAYHRAYADYYEALDRKKTADIKLEDY